MKSEPTYRSLINSLNSFVLTKILENFDFEVGVGNVKFRGPVYYEEQFISLNKLKGTVTQDFLLPFFHDFLTHLRGYIHRCERLCSVSSGVIDSVESDSSKITIKTAGICFCNKKKMFFLSRN